MAEQKFIKYGDREMALEPGMTLESAKELMARHFPELADPKVETKKTGDKTVYVFSKQAGHKGVNQTSDSSAIARRILRIKHDRTLPRALEELGHLKAGHAPTDPEAIARIAKLETKLQAEADAVEEVTQLLAGLPPAPGNLQGSIL